MLTTIAEANRFVAKKRFPKTYKAKPRKKDSWLHYRKDNNSITGCAKLMPQPRVFQNIKHV